MNLSKFSTILGVLLASLVAFQVSAAPVDSHTAEAVVKGWLKREPTPLAEKFSANIQNIETFTNANGEPLYYVVNVAPSGFVIVGADDNMEPIVAFVPRGRFNPSHTNALGALVAKDLPPRVARARAHPGEAHAIKSHHKWQELQGLSTSPGAGQPTGLSTVSSVWVAPFLKTFWDQQTINEAGSLACYNYYTPPYASGNADNYPCGCVATALSQLMYYFQYPTAGVGTGSFSITVNGASTNASLRGGDGLGGPYQWASMPPAPGNATPAQCQAIGALTHDAGVSINMEYAADGSGSTITGARAAMAQTFGYKNVIVAGQDSPNTSLTTTLPGIVNPNLDARIPVIFGIWETSGAGHCIVCDGYGYSSSTLYHHLNMGWSGYDNAWYALPIIDTADGVDFATISSCIYNTYVSGSGEIISGRVVDDIGLPISGASVTATRSSGDSYTATTDTNGIYALIKLPSASKYAISVVQNGYSSGAGNYSTGTSRNYSLSSGDLWGANFTLSLAGPPALVTPPQNALVLEGATAVFNLVASGAGTLSYQWSLNGVPLNDGGSISGSTSNSLTITSATSANAGAYTVIVNSSLGSITSAPVILTVDVPEPTQLVQNGDFETGSFASWTTSGNTSDSSVTTQAPYVYAGHYGASVGPFASLGYLSQTISTTPGGFYLLSLWLNSPDGLAPNQFLVDWNGVTLTNESNLPETGWVNLQFLVTATSASTPLEIGYRNDQSYFGIDSVTLSPLTSATPPVQSAPLPAIQVNTNGQVTLQIDGLSGQGNVIIQASTDLVNWAPISTNAATSGTLQLTDSAATNFTSRYYRAIVQSP